MCWPILLCFEKLPYKMKMFQRNSQCAFLVKLFFKDFGNELNWEYFVFCALILGETTSFWKLATVLLLSFKQCRLYDWFGNQKKNRLRFWQNRPMGSGPNRPFTNSLSLLLVLKRCISLAHKLWSLKHEASGRNRRVDPKTYIHTERFDCQWLLPLRLRPPQ